MTSASFKLDLHYYHASNVNGSYFGNPKTVQRERLSAKGNKGDLLRSRSSGIVVVFRHWRRRQVWYVEALSKQTYIPFLMSALLHFASCLHCFHIVHYTITPLSYICGPLCLVPTLLQLSIRIFIIQHAESHVPQRCSTPRS